MPRTITIHAGEPTAAAEGRTRRDLERLYYEAVEAGDYRHAVVLGMAGALLATNRAEEDEALAGVSWAMERATQQPDRAPVPKVPEVPEVPAPPIVVLLDWGVPVYRVGPDGSHVSGPWYGDAPAGAGWKRSGRRPGWAP